MGWPFSFYCFLTIFFIIVYLITYIKSIYEYYFAKQSIVLLKSSLQNRHHQQYLHRWIHHKKSKTKWINPQLHHPFEHDAHLRYRVQQNPIQGVPQHQSIQFQMTQMKCRCVSFVKYLELLKIWLSKYSFIKLAAARRNIFAEIGLNFVYFFYLDVTNAKRAIISDVWILHWKRPQNVAVIHGIALTVTQR